MEKQQGKAWVIMGVSGCGKSETGSRLARLLDVPFIEGDKFHPEANVRKMTAGIPLDDTDRAGWLQALRDEIVRGCADGGNVVLACSALKRAYRDLLRDCDADVHFFHLQGERDVIETRMRARADHYMPASLLDSQLRLLEPLQADERGITLDNAQPLASVVARVHEYAGGVVLQRRLGRLDAPGPRRRGRVLVAVAARDPGAGAGAGIGAGAGAAISSTTAGAPTSTGSAGTTGSTTGSVPEGITNPPIDDLLDQVSSKYALVIYAAKRARQINDYYSQLGEGLLEYVGPLVEPGPREKPLSIAMREIQAGLLEHTEGE